MRSQMRNVAVIAAIFFILSQAQALAVSLNITAVNGSVTANPSKSDYTPGEVVELMPKPHTGYSFSGWAGDAQGKSLVLKLTMDADKTVIANFATWQSPIGIPAPSFGITDTHYMYVGQTYDYGSGPQPYKDAGNGPYTHYIDSTHSAATDTNNPYGTASMPRKTVPGRFTAPLPAGSVVEIHGGPYTVGPFYNYIGWFAGLGTQQKPVFFRGTTGNPPVFDGMQLRAGGSYVIIENMDLNATTIAAHNDIGSDYISMRNLEVHGGPPVYTTAVSAGQGHDIVIYNNYIHHNGDPNWHTENDYHGTGVAPSGGRHAERVWIVDNHMHGNGGDSVQINSGGAKTLPEVARHIYIGRNVMHHEGENAVDLKSCADVVVSENIAYGFNTTQFATSGSDGTALIINDDTPHENIWMIFNTVYDSQHGIRAQDSGYLIGNRIYNIHNPAGWDSNETWGGLHTNSCGIIGFSYIADLQIIGNTLYDVDAGMIFPTGTSGAVINVVNNIIANLAQPAEYLGYGHTRITDNSVVQNNLFYQPGGTATIQTLTAATSSNIEADPQFVGPANADFHLQPNSPAIDTGTNSGVVQQVFDRFQTLYGIDIKKDIAGMPRTDPWDIGAYEYVSTTPLPGDVSGNGTITAYDASLAARYAAGLISLTPEQITRADVDKDSNVTGTDAVLIAQKAVDVNVVFPIEE